MEYNQVGQLEHHQLMHLTPRRTQTEESHPEKAYCGGEVVNKLEKEREHLEVVVILVNLCLPVTYTSLESNLLV